MLDKIPELGSIKSPNGIEHDGAIIECVLNPGGGQLRYVNFNSISHNCHMNMNSSFTVNLECSMKCTLTEQDSVTFEEIIDLGRNRMSYLQINYPSMIDSLFHGIMVCNLV